MTSLVQTPDEMISEAVMHVAASAIPLIVEGQSDHLLLASLLDEHAVSVIRSGTRASALDVVEVLRMDALKDRKVGGLLVLVDRDLDLEPGRVGRLLVTTACDLDSEACLVSGLLDRVVRHAHKLTSDEEVRLRVARVQEAAHAFHAARVTAWELGIGPNFGRLNPVIEAGDFTAASLTEALDLEESKRDAFLSLLQQRLLEEPDLGNCRGHDVHLVMSWGTKGGRDRIQELFAMGIDVQAFWTTATGAAMKAWSREVGVDVWRRHAAA